MRKSSKEKSPDSVGGVRGKNVEQVNGGFSPVKRSICFQYERRTLWPGDPYKRVRVEG